jgi:predicted alpha/beta-hydrolase family hydrolase
MPGTIVLSHGLESGPDATKVTALAAVARAHGWRELRPDYRDLDALRDPARIGERTARLLAHVPRDGSRFVLAGSSMGAFCSALASLEVRPQALFLLAPPLVIPGYAAQLDVAAVPLAVVHGWDDEIIPVRGVIDWAARRRATLHLVPDSHRLSDHVDIVARWFDEFLSRLPA